MPLVFRCLKTIQPLLRYQSVILEWSIYIFTICVIRFHTYNAARQSETVPVGSTVVEEEIFARPPDSRTPRGWLVDLINRLALLSIFDFKKILRENFDEELWLSLLIRGHQNRDKK